MANLTRQEFMEKYGQVIVEFSDYYKFTFRYVNVRMASEGGTISVEFGGNAEDIYRHDLSSNERIKVVDLEPFSGTVRDAGGNVVDEFYDY